MKPFEIGIKDKVDRTYDYSSTQINLPPDLAQSIIDWGLMHIPDEILTAWGRETEIHCTLKYGLLTTNPEDVRAVLKSNPTQPIKVTLGKVSIFDLPEYDVVQIGVSSPQLEQLNAVISKSLPMVKSLPNEDQNPVYRPHITIAYAQKGTVGSLVGGVDFEGQSFTANEIVFSGKDGMRETITIREGKSVRLNISDPAVDQKVRDIGLDELTTDQLRYIARNMVVPAWAVFDSGQLLGAIASKVTDGGWNWDDVVYWMRLARSKSVKGGLISTGALEVYNRYTNHGVIQTNLEVYHWGYQVLSMDKVTGGVMLHMEDGRSVIVEPGTLLDVQAYA